ncbi:MAG: hypothetical protein WBG37_11485 [Desulfobacterales bacterium]
MKDSSSLHLKVQEQCDCFALNDPLKEMAAINRDPDPGEAAVKWLALAALHGINSNAKKITLIRDKDGATRVVATYRDTELPTPDAQIGKRIVETVREITHITEAKGKTPLALGIRDSSLNMKVKIKSKGGSDQITLKFPQ